MFERFTDRARQAIVRAQEEARQLNHGWIGTEHLLLGLIGVGEGVAGEALATLGISLDDARREVEAFIPRGTQQPSGHLPLTPRSKKVLELAVREAQQLNPSDWIGTGYILLSLIREIDGVAAHVLVRRGVDLDLARQQVIQVLSSRPREVPPTGGPAFRER
jgi:ATP-dependent Clp protease ATP-binding subunit ClpC